MLPTIKNYIDIDLHRGSDAYNEIMSKVTEEASAKAKDIELTKKNDDMPPYLTPQMRSWYLRYVEGPRRSALREIKTAFESVKNKQGTPGFFLEADLEEIETREYNLIKGEENKFKAALIEKNIADWKEGKVAEYAAMRTGKAKGRDAQEWKPIQYWFGIVGVIIIESLLNFEGFIKIPGVTPFFATGMVLATALFIGYAAHRHGIFVRQFGEEMGGHQGRKNKSTVISREIIALLLLVAAMGVIAWGRYHLIQPIILDCQLDPESCKISPWAEFLIAMLGNVGVYLFGVLWSYWHHDPIPYFMELRIEKENSEKEYNVMYDTMVTARVRQHKSLAEKEKEEKRTADQFFKSLPEYQEIRRQFQKLRTKDSEVLAVLDDYRNVLVKEIREAKNQSLFVLNNIALNVEEPTVEAADAIERRLTPEQYQGLRLRLQYRC